MTLNLPTIIEDDCTLTQKGMVEKTVSIGLPRFSQSSVSKTLKLFGITRKRIKKGLIVYSHLNF